MIWDPLYFLLMAPAMLLAMWAQFRVKSTFAQASRIAPRSRLSGAEAAARLLAANDLSQVAIEHTRGFLGDHYDPRSKTLRLSPDVYEGRSLAAVGVAAHEAGHALQDRAGYAPLKFRNGIVPLASFGGNFSVAIFIVGAFMHSTHLMLAGIVLFSVFVFFQLITLPVEYNASRRARMALIDAGIIGHDEEPVVAKVLNAAALTYVAATISAIMTLLYFILRSGILSRRE